MTRRLQTLHSLARWRALGEQSAAVGHRRARLDEAAAEGLHRECMDTACALQSARSALVREGLLDFDRLSFMAACEGTAWTREAGARDGLDRARDAREAACAAHALARAHQRLADKTVACAEHAHHETRDKRDFDALSSMITKGCP